MKTYWKNSTKPVVPYYAVIFISEKKENLSGYEEMNHQTLKLALSQAGCLGYSDAPGVFISYWDSLESIHNWKNNPVHREAKEKGIQEWYAYYHSMICKVEQTHEFFNP